MTPTIRKDLRLNVPLMCPICNQSHLKRKCRYGSGRQGESVVGDTLQRAAPKVGYYSKMEAEWSGVWGMDSEIK